MTKKEIIEAKVESRINRVWTNSEQRLDLSNCGLTEIPDVVFNFSQLVFLNLGTDIESDDDFKNKITNIPEKINKLKNLKTLILKNNKIVDISKCLGDLKLKTIDISNNSIEMLPFEIPKISTLESLDITNNPLMNIPPEIALRGLASINNFIKELEEKDYLYEVKLILVGEGRVGKTSLVKTLSLPNYILEDEQSTKGINVSEWNIPKSELSISDFPFIRDSFTLNIWDFGGQEIYHSTHQFFLTKRSIYLLVTESRKEDRHDDFYYWLNIIKILGDKSPVLIVMNKCDQPTKELPIGEYKNAFENIINYTKVSCKSDFSSTILVLKDEIKRIIKNKKLLPHIGTPMPKRWVDVRIDIDKLVQDGKDYITYDEYLEICKKHYIFGSSADFCSEFFHDLGVILHFKDDIHLKDTVILNSEWVTKGVYKILDNNDIIENHGVFTSEDIENIWQENQYREKRKELISLMKNTKFELIFELGDGKYLAPQLLPVDEIPYEWRSNSNNLLFEFRYKFMPKGILTRTIVKRNADIYENTYWRYGVLLEYEGTRAIVRERYLENKIIIKLEGPNKKEFLAIIRKTIHEINSEYNNIEVHEMVPCNCIECKNKDPYFYKYNALRRYQQNERTEIVCEKSLTNINIKSIFSDSIFESYEINQNEIIDTKMTNINIKIDNTNNNNLTNKVNIEISNEIQISINGLIADCANLKEELLEVSSENDEEIIISEFNKIDTSLQNLNEAKNLDTIDKTKLSKLKLFIEKISNPSTKIGEVFKKVENGISTLQNIGKYYNSIAEWTGLPQIPSVFVK